MQIVLIRNGIWSDAAHQYLTSVVERCTGCHSTALPQPRHKVSLSSLSRDFNDYVCLDPFFLDGIRIFLVMDASNRFSAGLVCDGTSIATAIHALEEIWMSPFCHPVAIQVDQDFINSPFSRVSQWPAG